MDRQASELYKLKAGVLQAIAHPLRLAILDVLSEGEHCVCDIAAAVGAKRSNISRHLAVMLSGGILASRREGLQVFYQLRTPCILNSLDCVANVLREQLSQRSALIDKL
ncbi:MAG TPA: metalloregulator ArsR/SmtB family transcription factor [Planctomycetota bacterium]|nr:metalloregulator ArsR/SmtB family transcription factor [Planctomycetota bacterium]